jgi:drug/metabolite transporter (DMT)-like permease
MPLAGNRLSRVPPANLNLRPRFERLEVASPAFSSVSCESNDIEDYIGSGTDTVGGRTPAVDKRLFIQEPVSASDGSPGAIYDSDDDDDSAGMGARRPPFVRNGDSRSGQPLLSQPGDDDYDARGRARYNHSRTSSPLRSEAGDGNHAPSHRPPFSRRSTMRSRSPDTQAKMAARKKYIYAAIFLAVSLVSFCVQTELAAYVQQDLGWDKAYCMLYFTHGSWAMLWPAQLLILRVQKWNMPWQTFWRRHVYLLRSTAHMIRSQDLDVPRHMMNTSPWPYIIKSTALITSSLTVAGLSWYIAVNMTSPSDLTAIYNCSAFFAYAFSVPLLKEKLRLDKSIAVLVAVVGVMVVAYGDSKPGNHDNVKPDHSGGSRFLGNLIIGAGSVLYGLYEVLYKRWACPPEGVSAGRGMIFANAFGSCIGMFTLTVLWVPLPILHILGWETFELPTGETAWYLWVSVVMNATFAGSFLVLISLTSPVLSSVAALLTIFIVAIVDWLRTGESMSFAAISGGVMIIVAFVMLSWSTYREMVEDAERKAAEGNVEADWDSESGAER